MRRMGKSGGANEAELVETAVHSLGLRSVADFDAKKKVIEYAVASPAVLAGRSLSDFSDDVAADSPVPGGGAVAALAGSLAAALSAMVANLTVGKKGYEESWKALDGLAIEAQGLKARLLRAVDEDAQAFNAVIAAQRLPKSTDQEREVRNAAIQSGYKDAARIPLETAYACRDVLRVCGQAAELGNRNSLSDGGVGALMASAAAEGAVLNVLINLKSIEDESWTAGMRSDAEALLAETHSLRDQVLERVRREIAS